VIKDQIHAVALDRCGWQPPNGHGAAGYRLAEEVKLADEKQFKGFPIDSGNGQVGP
jgi:hypothetical protein